MTKKTKKVTVSWTTPDEKIKQLQDEIILMSKVISAARRMREATGSAIKLAEQSLDEALDDLEDFEFSMEMND